MSPPPADTDAERRRSTIARAGAVESRHRRPRADRGALLGMVLLGCTPRAPATAQTNGATPAEAAPVAAAHVEAAAAVAAIDPPAALPGEASPEATSDGVAAIDPASASASADEEPAPIVDVPRGSAFVLYTARRTVVVPMAGGARAIEGAGLWFQEERPGSTRVRFLVGDAFDELPICGAGEVACDRERVVDVVDGAAPCACRPETGPEVEIDADDEDHCDESWLNPASIVGDRLHWLGAAHSVCGGFNRYDAISSEMTLFEGTGPIRQEGLGSRSCDPETGPGDPPTAWLLDPGPCVAVAGGWTRRGGKDPADPECVSCGEYSAEAELWFLGRGRLHRIEDNIFFAGGTRWVRSVAATPERCPSPADPCGDPRRFRALAGEDDFWVEGAGRHALIVDGDAVSIARAGAAEAERRGDAPEGAILGVRVHRDPGPLVRAMTGVDRRPRPRGEEARAVGPGSGACDPSRPCPGDSRCEDGRCRVDVALAPDDSALLDGGSRALGDRCVVHLREGRLGAATAACEAALSRATTERSRGALLFNLGRIAETLGDREEAAARYRRSLEARPNEVVEAALARVVGGE
ncbi:MAG: tetratricopeptide repeat protein [Nannocystaceae bacterium]